MKKSILFVLLSAGAYAQEIELEEDAREKVSATFKSGNLINVKTTETLHKGELDFRVDHRFGDIAGKAGGAKTFFGMDQSTDIRIGFDYGISDNLTLGIARAKGAGPATQLYEGVVKYRFLEQNVSGGIPVSAAFFGSALLSGAKASEDLTSPTSYRNFAQRFMYVSQIIVARKFSPGISFELLPTYVHRNYTAYGDQNGILALGLGGRMKVTKRMALVADYFLPFSKRSEMEEIWGQKYYNALGLGLELETGGHVFHLNFTNATAVQEAQIIPETTRSWGKGEFRWGFSIARRFSFDKK
jgi:hypothetical protein